MKKFGGKYWQSDLFLGGIVLCTGLLAIGFTSPTFGFSSMGEMGTSATGMALIRSMLNPPNGATTPFMGYILNGTIHQYWNWPPYGFQVYAWWLELMGDKNLTNARMLSALIYALTAVLFYFLLRKNNVSVITAIASSLVFIFLPMHLKYGHMVYADIWLPFFWTLALYVLDAQTLRRYWLFFLIILLGTTFMWFVIFLLPVPMVLKALRKYHMSKRMTVAIWAGIYLMAMGLVWLVVNSFIDDYRIMKLENWSFLKLLREFNGFVPQLLNRLKYLGFESFILVVIAVLSFRSLKGLLDPEVQAEYKGLIHLMIILFSGLLFYVLIMPVWFVIHHYGLSMFSILIATTIALVLSVGEKYEKGTHLRNAVVVVGLALGLYLIFPSNHPKVDQVNQISFVINQQNFDQKPCVFIDLQDFHHWEHAVEFGIKELTQGYIFNQDYLKQKTKGVDLFQSAKSQLQESGLLDYHKTQYLLITNEKEQRTSGRILLEIDGIRIYHVEP